MSNPNSLKPFQRGYDPRRNTKGRPKAHVTESKLLSQLIEKHLNKKVTLGNGRRVQKMDLLAERLADEGIRGKISAIKLIMNFIEGKPPTYEQVQKRMGNEYIAKNHGTLTDEDLKKLREVFPDSVPPESK